MLPIITERTQSSSETLKVYDNIIKSERDKRQYRGVELINGLKVLLVSDPTTDISAASMDVHIGSMKDPESLNGLSHFLEHMLFLGTQKVLIVIELQMIC